MRTWSLLLALMMLSGGAAGLDVSSAEVQGAIDRAKVFLLSKQVKGNWELAPQGVYENDQDPQGGQWGGMTALATYALLAAGGRPAGPRGADGGDAGAEAEGRGADAGDDAARGERAGDARLHRPRALVQSQPVAVRGA